MPEARKLEMCFPLLLNIPNKFHWDFEDLAGKCVCNPELMTPLSSVTRGERTSDESKWV